MEGGVGINIVYIRQSFQKLFNPSLLPIHTSKGAPCALINYENPASDSGFKNGVQADKKFQALKVCDKYANFDDP